MIVDWELLLEAVFHEDHGREREVRAWRAILFSIDEDNVKIVASIGECETLAPLRRYVREYCRDHKIWWPEEFPTSGER